MPNPLRSQSHLIADGLDRLAKSLDRLTAVLESRQERLGDGDKSRYTRSSEPSDLVDEKAMAAILNISYRTLGRHRRAGRLPNCWVRNGGRILWRASQTQEAWERGIA